MAGLRKHAVREKVEHGPDLAVNSGYESSEPLAKRLPDRRVDCGVGRMVFPLAPENGIARLLQAGAIESMTR